LSSNRYIANSAMPCPPFKLEDHWQKEYDYTYTIISQKYISSPIDDSRCKNVQKQMYIYYTTARNRTRRHLKKTTATSNPI
jgi:hypothetical protein